MVMGEVDMQHAMSVATLHWRPKGKIALGLRSRFTVYRTGNA